MPDKSGWYWVFVDGYDEPYPCWYMGPDDECFLMGGMGDTSSDGVYEDEIIRVGPSIEVPIF